MYRSDSVSTQRAKRNVLGKGFLGRAGNKYIISIGYIGLLIGLWKLKKAYTSSIFDRFDQITNNSMALRYMNRDGAIVSFRAAHFGSND